jgi:hypothetical protein
MVFEKRSRCPSPSPLPSPREKRGEGVVNVAAVSPLPVLSLSKDYGERMPAGR